MKTGSNLGYQFRTNNKFLIFEKICPVQRDQIINNLYLNCESSALF